MTAQRKSELDAVNRRIARNDPRSCLCFCCCCCSQDAPTPEQKIRHLHHHYPHGPLPTYLLLTAHPLARRLVELTLAWTACGDPGIEAISDVLKVNTVVTDLNLYHNDIGPRGAAALARALRKNYTLSIINLDMNNIGDEGVQEFMDTLNGFNTSLTVLKVANNHVNPVQLRDLNVLLEKNTCLKIDLDWHKVQNKILPLKFDRGEAETKKTYLKSLKEAEDPQVIEQIEACEDEIEEIDHKIGELLKKEDKILEDGTWFQRKFDKLRTTVLTYMNVHKAVSRLRPKQEDKLGPTLEEERTQANNELTELQGRFLSPEANKWKPEYRKEMEAQVRALQLKLAGIRSKERAYVTKLQLEKQMKLQDAANMKEQLRKGDNNDLDRFKPKTMPGRFEVPPEEKMPLTHKYTAFDRKLREAGVSVPKDEITYRPMAESQNLGRRFQEAFIDPQDRVVLGVRRKDRNPKNIYYKPNKYGADLVY